MKYALLLAIALYSNFSHADNLSEKLSNLCTKMKDETLTREDLHALKFSLVNVSSEENYKIEVSLCNTNGGCSQNTYDSSNFDSSEKNEEIHSILLAQLGCQIERDSSLKNIKVKLFESHPFKSNVLIAERTLTLRDAATQAADLDMGSAIIKVEVSEPEFAVEPGTFDEAKTSTIDSKYFKARYRGIEFLAWTGDENDSLSNAELQGLAESRALAICQYFGYKNSSARRVESTKASEAYLILNGRPTMVQAIESGSAGGALAAVMTMGATIDAGRVFKGIECSK